MKKIILSKSLWVMLIILIFKGVSAQVSYTVQLRNPFQPTTKTFEFDVYVSNTGPVAIEYANIQCGVVVNPNIKNGGTITAGMVKPDNTIVTSNGTGTGILSDFDFLHQPSTITFTAAQNCIKMSGKTPSPGTFIPIGAEYRVAKIRLTNTVDFTANTTPNMTFNFTSSPYLSAMQAYVGGLNTTVTGLGTWSNATGNPPLNPVYATPFPMGSNASYCQGTTGAQVTLSNSQAGYNYTLIKNGIATSTIIAGTGSSLDFGFQLAGIYKVVANPNSTMMLDSTIITETPNTIPSFTQLGPYCVGATADIFPLTSTNGIAGTWNPASISTASAGTTTYTFTPTAVVGQCYADKTMDVTVNAPTLPTFAQLGPYCLGATAGILSSTSTNGISGTWNPAIISTASLGTSTYTFTPDAGQCASTATMDVEITSTAVPTFTQLGPYCIGSTPALLPATSNNNITGTWNPATISTSLAGSTDYTFTPNAGECGSSVVMTIVVNDPVTPTFTQLGPYCNGATPGTLPLNSTNGINGTWNPATVNTAAVGSTTYTFTPTAGQCAIATTMDIVVNAIVIPTFTQLGPYCVGATPGTLPTTSTNGISGTWNPTIVSTTTAGSTTYTFTPTVVPGQCTTTTTMSIVVNSNTVPTFTQLGPYCPGSTPDLLPVTSTNGIAGTWNPATINTATSGTTVYTFTPTPVPGQCYASTTMSIIVHTLATPSFAVFGPYCEGATPAVLPTTSNNGITGTWNPTAINTSIIGPTTYTFTPTAGVCASVKQINITVNANTVPAFTQLGPYCTGATPGSLPTTSTNGINGTWNPATISTATVGSTTYTFTPNAGLCATTATMSITVNPVVTPAFTQLGPYCVGATPGILPTTSNNGVSGTWNPATISTATAGNTTYTFTPTAGQCANTATMTITINANTMPTFTQLGPYCIGATPGTLPLTSNNSITGTWNPATISTSAAGSTTYTFTPTAGQCATTKTMTIVVNALATPTFTQLGPYCVNATPATLPSTSTNSIAGTWNPATISTAAAGTTTYTFTPNAGQCGNTTTMDIVVNANVTPTFTQLGPYCINGTPGTLPLTSNNSITGTWNPATISTSATGTTSYTFTPNAGQCATTASMGVLIDPCTGVEDLQDISNLVIYPNPTSDRVFINYDNLDINPTSLRILNSLGQVCFQTNTPLLSNEQGIDVSGFATGTYTVQVLFNDKIVNKPIIIHKN